ncbi:MAG: GspH/FimT family pseudopilin [Desulfobacterales bacterium]|nr:GspH/FimT family pseudopilin [Desulfobacterales bacterium]
MMGRGVKRHPEKGVTIIELAVVMAIIGIMALFMAPSIGEWTAGFRLRGATKDLADALQLARLKAISTRNQYRVQLTINNGTDAESFVLQGNDPTLGWTNEGASITLPTGVNIDNIDATDTGTITRTFNTNGTATGWGGNATSTICLENRRDDRYRVIISQTGMIKMRDGW